METLFLKVINMSITASYVILFVMLVRMLLTRAPKKIAYALWSVVLFRLTCPVSFSSLFSIFQVKPFDMSVAQQAGGAALGYVPANIGLMDVPRATVGIPTLNSFINDSLPAATIQASHNPLQLWITMGAILWCAGAAALLIYGIIGVVQLKRRVATAVRLEGNVFEADHIRSPFILGLFKPRIYIPFGLGGQERAYILQHEYYHLKRRDHLIKALSFLVLAIHWFNPLVWLAFVSMNKDMEMSCDEKVLSEAGTGIAKAYSASLLSFAMNRRNAFGVSLAFGESGIRERIKNILRFKTAPRWVVVSTVALCVAAITAFAANPVQSPASRNGIDNINDLYGNYKFEKQIYMNPLSSFLALDGFREYYSFTPNRLIRTDADWKQHIRYIDYKPAPLDEQEFRNSFMFETEIIPELSSYKEKYQYTLSDDSGAYVYRIYVLDDEIWLARFHTNSANHQKSSYLWSIYQISKMNEEIPANASTVVYGSQDGVQHFLSLHRDWTSRYVNDTVYNITPDEIRENSEYTVFKYDSSAASFLLYENEIYPLGVWDGGFGVTSMALADSNGDGKPELYFTYSWGSGLHRSHVAYFDPADKQTSTLDYVHLNEDMILEVNEDNGLSLYAAAIASVDNFAHFELERGQYLTDLEH